MHEKINIKEGHEFNGEQERICGSVFSRSGKGETQLSYNLEKVKKKKLLVHQLGTSGKCFLFFKPFLA